MNQIERKINNLEEIIKKTEKLTHTTYKGKQEDDSHLFKSNYEHGDGQWGGLEVIINVKTNKIQFNASYAYVYEPEIDWLIPLGTWWGKSNEK